MAIVLFDPTAFKEAYPQFAAFTDAQLQQAFNVACLVCPNTDASPVPYCPDDGVYTRATLLNMLVCHLCTLSQRGGAVGTLSSASEGSVSASFTLPQVQNAEWFAQTPCGLTYWQATAQYRTGGIYYAGCFR